MANKRTIEIFTAGCPFCTDTVQAVKQAVASCGCNVVERNVLSAEARQYGIRAVPTVVIDGQITFERKPTDQEINSLTLNP